MYLPAWLDGLTPEMVEKAEEELGETPENTKKALKELTQLLEDEPNLKPRLENRFLMRYLRAKKYNVHKAFQTLLNFYTFQAKYSGILTRFRPSQMKRVLDMNCITVLPYRDEDGCSIGLVRLENFDVTQGSGEELTAASLLCAEIGLDQEATIVCGSVAILDLKGFTMKQMFHFSSPTLLSLIVSSFQDCMACRVKGLHVVNEPYYFNVIGKVVKKLLNKKLKDRLYFHGDDMESLHKVLPPVLLPEYLGGQQKPNYKEYNALILSKEEYFEKINKFGFPSNYAMLYFHGDDMESLHKVLPPVLLPEYLGGQQKPNYKEYNALILSKEEYFEKINKFGFPSNYAMVRKRMSIPF